MGPIADNEPNTTGTERPPVRDPDSVLLAYLSCPTDPAGNFLGALLLTDARTRPLHFTYVAPVRPTLMQRILYGSTLTQHVKIDVIAKKLFGDGAVAAPHVIFVDNRDLLRVRDLSGFPAAHLYRPRETERTDDTLSSVVYDTGGNLADQDTVGRIVAQLDQAVDLVDPFNRIRDALKEALKSAKES